MARQRTPTMAAITYSMLNLAPPLHWANIYRFAAVLFRTFPQHKNIIIYLKDNVKGK
jgi:hypothetical protein